MAWRTAAGALLVATLVGLGACERVEPAEFTSNDKQDRQDCPPGRFTGEDGVLTIGIPLEDERGRRAIATACPARPCDKNRTAGK